MPTLAGTKLDKYDMLEEVGHGGMAVVYRGRDTVLDREVAVKVLHPHLADREESRERLRREALAVAKLRHENILEIFDYSGPAAAESYIVTEFIHGPTLRQWLDEDYVPRPAVAALVVHRLALALAQAHKSGIVHRDIKPENVMIRREDGCVKLMDFGIAQILDNQKLTMTGQLIGSPAYMAPELINGRPLDARTDLFSLGILLYQLATGELPFSGRNPHEVLNRIADGNYPLPSTVCPLCDKELEAIIGKALASNPDDRYQSTEALAKELENYLAEIEVDPEVGELKQYFRGPKDYLAQLDERVSTALMAHAERAAREGLHARAIRLLGRVLEIDGSNKEARAMLSRLRVRAKRMRQVVLGGAALGAVGLVGAVAVLIPPGALEPDPPAIADGRLEEPPVPIGASVGDVARRPDAKTPTSPPRPQPEPGGNDADAVADSTTGGDARPRPGKTTPSKPAPPRAELKTDCKITIEGVAPSTARNWTLAVQPDDGERDIVKVTGLEVSFSFDGTAARVSISEAGWSGSRHVDRKDCLAGATLSVSPKPARVVFKGDGTDQMVVSCVQGCEAKQVMADKFPALSFEPGQDSLDVTLELVAVDFITARKKYTLHPGPNTLPVDLKRRTSG
ncbi:MAG TPA: protein kinase [Nannocystaceae bacterium]|nr:protein kinase [Nannocystaceae bacterium]